MMKNVIREALLRRQDLIKYLKEMESESEISGRTVGSNSLRLARIGQV